MLIHARLARDMNAGSALESFLADRMRQYATLHVLQHDCPRIDLPKVWLIVENQVPPLIAALEPLVPPESS